MDHNESYNSNHSSDYKSDIYKNDVTSQAKGIHSNTCNPSKSENDNFDIDAKYATTGASDAEAKINANNDCPPVIATSKTIALKIPYTVHYIKNSNNASGISTIPYVCVQYAVPANM